MKKLIVILALALTACGTCPPAPPAPPVKLLPAAPVDLTVAPAPTLDEMTPGLTNAQAIGVVTSNYERYQDVAKRLVGFQKFYDGLLKEQSKK